MRKESLKENLSDLSVSLGNTYEFLKILNGILHFIPHAYPKVLAFIYEKRWELVFTEYHFPHLKQTKQTIEEIFSAYKPMQNHLSLRESPFLEFEEKDFIFFYSTARERIEVKTWIRNTLQMHNISLPHLEDILSNDYKGIL